MPTSQSGERGWPAYGPTSARLSSDPHGPQVAGDPGRNVVLERDHNARILEVARPRDDEVLAASPDLRQRDEIELSGELEREREGPDRITTARAVELLIEASDENAPCPLSEPRRWDAHGRLRTHRCTNTR